MTLINLLKFEAPVCMVDNSDNEDSYDYMKFLVPTEGIKTYDFYNPNFINKTIFFYLSGYGEPLDPVTEFTSMEMHIKVTESNTIRIVIVAKNQVTDTETIILNINAARPESDDQDLFIILYCRL